MNFKVLWIAGVMLATMAGQVQAGMITFGSGSNTFNMEFVAIGNANNADDMTGNPGVAGKVEYEYQMGKFEVSEDMITKFNASQALQITKDTKSTKRCQEPFMDDGEAFG